MAIDKSGQEDIQKIKLVGPLWTTKLVVSILRDILLIVFLIVAVVGIVFVVTSLSSALSGAGGLGGLVGSIVGGGQDFSGQDGGQMSDSNR